MKPLALSLLCVSAFLAVRVEALTLFDANPAHPWNRLYAAIQGDPPLAQIPISPLKREVFPNDANYDELIAALDSFIERHAERLINVPAKRAILQSAVWATFDQASDPTASELARRDQVAKRCAEIIRRLALTDAEINALPDNYTMAVKSKTFAAEFHYAHRESAFLPPDLLDGKGPWVMMSGDGPDPAAVQHVRAVQGRSQFYAFIRLPGDRSATLAYLRELATFPQPYVWDPRYASQPNALSPSAPNPALPQFPKGTAVALLRLMILPNSSGELRVTPIAESVQLRVYSTDPKEAKCCDSDDQDFYEFRLDITGLFQGKEGLTHVLRSERPAPLLFEKSSLSLNDGGCNDCHGEVGVRSLLTYTHRFGPPRFTPWFEPALPASQDMETLQWKQRDYSWGLLRGLLMSTATAASR